MARRKKHPRFDGFVCIVKDCTRVEYKHELCRKHWEEVPLRERLAIMTDSMQAALKAAERHNPALRKWARNYPTGVQASAGKRTYLDAARAAARAQEAARGG